MAKIYDEMAASLLVSFLKTEIAAHDDKDASGIFLASASNALSPRDFAELIKSCRKKLAALEKQMGAPPEYTTGTNTMGVNAIYPDKTWQTYPAWSKT